MQHVRKGSVYHKGPAAEKRDLRIYANSEYPDHPVHSGQDLSCSPTQYRDHVEDTGLIAKILTRRVTAQTGPSCSKLTMSLVNDSLKFTSSDTQIRWNFLLKKCE